MILIQDIVLQFINNSKLFAILIWNMNTILKILTKKAFSLRISISLPFIMNICYLHDNDVKEHNTS